MNRDSTRYYVPSGAVPLTGLLKVAGVVLPGTIIATLIYAVLVRFTGLLDMRIKGIAMCFFIAGVGAATHYLIHWAMIRNRWFNALLGLGIGVYTLYWTWAWFPCAMNNWNPQAILLNPLHQWEWATQVADGLWQMDKKPVEAWQLYTIWGLEALGIVIAGLAGAIQADKPYCEECLRWTVRSPNGLTCGAIDEDELRINLEHERYDVFNNLPPLPSESMVLKEKRTLTRFNVDACEDCQENFLLTVSKVVITLTKEGARESVKPFIKWMFVPKDVVATLEKIATGRSIS